MKILLYDIETSSFNPQNNEWVDLDRDKENYLKFAKIKWFGAYSFYHKKFYILEMSQSQKFVKQLLNEHSVLIGWNNANFDDIILKNNGLIDEKTQTTDLMTDFIKAFLGSKKQRLLKLSIAGKFVNSTEQKGELNYKIFQKETLTQSEKKLIAEYLRADVTILKDVFIYLMKQKKKSEN